MNASIDTIDTIDVKAAVASFYGVLVQVKPAIVSRLPEDVLAELLRRRVLTLDGISAEQKTLDACIAAVSADPDAIASVPDAIKQDVAAGAAEAERWAYRAAVSSRLDPDQLAAMFAARDAAIVPFAA